MKQSHLTCFANHRGAEIHIYPHDTTYITSQHQKRGDKKYVIETKTEVNMVYGLRLKIQLYKKKAVNESSENHEEKGGGKREKR